MGTNRLMHNAWKSRIPIQDHQGQTSCFLTVFSLAVGEVIIERLGNAGMIPVFPKFKGLGGVMEIGEQTENFITNGDLLVDYNLQGG